MNRTPQDRASGKFVQTGRLYGPPKPNISAQVMNCKNIGQNMAVDSQLSPV